MNRSLISTIVICAALSGASVSAAPFEEIIGDDVELFFTIHSFSEIREQCNSHPMAELFEADFMAEWLKEATNPDDENNTPSLGITEELEDTFGLSVDELFELFAGQASLAIYNISDLILQKETRPDLVLMAEFSGDAEQLDELMQVQFERNAENHKKNNPLAEHEMIEESFMNETLHFDEVFDGEKTHIEDGYALVNGILILATPESRLREAVELVKADSRASISKSDVYLRYREHTDTADMALYINLVELMPPLNSALMKLPVFESLALFGVTAQSLETALSLESLQALYTDFELVEDGLLLKYGILFGEKLGFLSLVNYTDNALPEASYVPEDILGSSVSRFDLNAMLANFEKMLGLASPALPPLIDIQMQTMQTNVGVDIRASILENFGNQMVNFSVVNKDATDAEKLLQQQQIIAIDLKDTQAFRHAVNALKDISPVKSSIEEQTYEGETIYSLIQPSTPDTPEMQFNYAITRSKLLINIGHVSLLHEVLSAMASDKEGFWQNHSTKNLFERIERPNAVARSFLDIEQLIGPLFKLLAEGEPDNLPAFMQSGEIPEELKEPYRLISEVNEEPGSIFGRTLVIKIGENQ